ncbi:hypothetical protein LDENG_00008880 [Lucifuga dentata]|nr:hypothetical protein LDENG_00008880 [Lucifuga dentata]
MWKAQESLSRFPYPGLCCLPQPPFCFLSFSAAGVLPGKKKLRWRASHFYWLPEKRGRGLAAPYKYFVGAIFTIADGFEQYLQKL